MSNTTLKSKVAKGAIWTLMEKLSTQAVQFMVGMVLARLLTPNDYGTVSLTAIFFAVAGVLVDGGFGGALIQKRDADDLDFNSVFYLNLFMSALAYIALFFAAPWIARFYKTPGLVAIVRVSAIAFIFNAVNAIQGAELTKKMLFHLSFRISLITTFTSAICGVTLAFMGYGVWALVWSSLITGFVGVIARWLIIAWRPRLMFSWSRLRPLFSYGWKMAVSGLLNTFFNNLNGLVIGRLYSRADLAYVNKGRALPNMVMGEIDNTIGRVSFPALVQFQGDKMRLRDAMRRMMMCSTFLVLPLMVLVAACAHSELRLLYGTQWTPAAPYMMLACFTFALHPFHTINLRGILALGRSDIFLKLEIVKKALVLAVVIGASRLGVLTWMAISAFAIGPLSVIINSWPNRKLLDYPLRMQLMDVLPTILVCAVEGVVVVGLNLVGNMLKSTLGVAEEGTMLMVFLVVKLLLQAVLGLGTFFVLAYVFRLKPLGEYARMVATAIGGRFPGIAMMLQQRFLK